MQPSKSSGKKLVRESQKQFMVLVPAGGGSPSAVLTTKGRDGLSVNVSDIQEPVHDLVFRTSGLMPVWRW